MKKYVLLIITFVLLSCKNEKLKPLPLDQKYIVNSRALELYKKALNEIHFKKNKKAINLLEQAIDIDNRFTAAYQEAVSLHVQKKMYNKALLKNKKLIELYPTSLYYLAQRGLLFEILHYKIKAESNYSQARKLLSENENYYWKKYDSVGFSLMLIEIGDSLRGRKLIDLIIEKKSNNGFPEKDLREFQRKTRGEILSFIKQSRDSIESKLTNSVEIENIIEGRN